MDDLEVEMLSSKYYEPKQITSLLNTSNHLTFCYLNISSLLFQFEEFSAFFSKHNLNTEITESRLKLNKNPIKSIQLPGYHTEFAFTESSNEVTLLHIKKA